MPNLDEKTVRDFGKEWASFDQSDVTDEELDRIFEGYFRVFPWDDLPDDPVGMDVGCGSGRWAQRVAPKVGKLHCIDASAQALEVTKSKLRTHSNCRFHHASVDAIPIPDDSLDFGYSLGVLHHLPDTEGGLRSCVEKLQIDAPFLLYLYYALDNKPTWFRILWRLSDMVRAGCSQLPHPLKVAVSGLVASLLYLPLARLALLWEQIGRDSEKVPLSFYKRLSFYTMRTDALDRFGTRLEKRFRKEEVESMMKSAGLGDISFSPEPPYWCAVGFRKT